MPPAAVDTTIPNRAITAMPPNPMFKRQPLQASMSHAANVWFDDW